ncbi:hypothetical protein HN803_03635 [candidate division WWE3 bacterium]|jgi:uncharacterized membrane protein YfcA|nr:hypothetical protein [Candidatus Scalindua sp.]MBT7349860.1 hypothetical protein [candidate division WWE3 bacterium]
MEWILAKLGIEAVQYAMFGVGGVIIAWALKRIPNDVIKAKFGAFMYGAGVTCTLGLTKWKWTKKFWNKLIEPWAIDVIDNIIVTGVSKFVEGLRSDND